MNELADRERKHTAKDVLRRIDDDTFASLSRHAETGRSGRTGERLSELDREWDTDRALEIEAATMGLLGLALGAFLDRRYLALPAFVAASVLVHANTGRYPLIPVFRRLGLRTAREIERERYGLKALRGDFLNMGRRPRADEAVSGAPVESVVDTAELFPPTSTRVERNTAPRLNEAIRERTDAEMVRLESAGRDAITAHLRKLDEEWGVERTLQANASTLVLAGVALGAFVDRRFLLLPAAVFGFFAQHALQGWCPPIPIFRRLGVRTVREIERERHATKALRGDFDRLPAEGTVTTSERVRAVMAAVDA